MQTKDNAHFHIVLVKGWVRKNGKFLLARRGLKELHKPGVWSLPGGKVDDEIEQDILVNTLKREIKEEINIEIQDKTYLVNNNSFKRVDDTHVVNLTFLCDYKSGEPQPLEDTSELGSFTLDELKKFPDAEDWMIKEVESLVQYLEQ